MKLPQIGLSAVLLVILGVVVLMAANPGARAGDPYQDSDGDSLPDYWETGTTPDGLDLAALGADPNHKDLFIEVDFNSEAYRSKLPCSSLDEIYRMFKRAPLQNPDGKNGVTVHIDAGLECPSRSYDFGGSNNSVADPVVISDSCDSSMFTNAFEVGSTGRMEEERLNVFHHVYFANLAVPNNDPFCGGLLGVARSLGSRQFIVAVGAHDAFARARRVPEILGTFVHELGHDLGLHHGGGYRSRNPYKPNHFSVMNYVHAGGIFMADGSQVFDYQRFGVPKLDERHLDETRGVQSARAAKFSTFHFCLEGNDLVLLLEAPANAPVDWNCDEAAEDTDTAYDIDASEFILGHFSPLKILGRTPNEWALIYFSGGGGGIIGVPQEANARTLAPEPLDPRDEMTADDRLQFE